MSTVISILDFLFEHKADRRSLLIAIGGGITLDVAGFAASIYKRGIEWVAIPTTLLAQVDASVGGKTAINHKTGKNAIGSFHPSAEVIISSLAAFSWKSYHYEEGVAEMYKIFSLFDPDSARTLVQNGNSEDLTRRSIELKAQVVDLDPWETRLRACLNFGHTIGHAIEHVTGIRHGIAVGMGMRIENAIAARIGLLNHEALAIMDRELCELGFDGSSSLPDFEYLAPLILQDKKNTRGEVRMALCPSDGLKLAENIDPCVAVPMETIREVYIGCRDS